jgi:hypothetical protein
LASKTTALVVDAGAVEEEFEDDVVLVAGGVYGAGWATLTFEMLSVNWAGAPAYFQWISVAPQVNISGTVWKENPGEVFVGGGEDTVGEVVVDMMGEAGKSGKQGWT